MPEVGHFSEKTSLVNLAIVSIKRLPIALRSREASREEDRREHEAEQDRDLTVVPLHPGSQRLKHLRGPLREGRVEADQHENRDGENEEHQAERQDAAQRTKARDGDEVEARDEDGEVFDLDREYRHPEYERSGRRDGPYGLHPPGRLSVGIRYVEEAPEAKDDEQAPDRNAEYPFDGMGGISRIPEDGEPHNAYHQADCEVAEREGRGVGKGPVRTQEQDGEEEQGRRDRATDGQDDELGERLAHECTALRSSGGLSLGGCDGGEVFMKQAAVGMLARFRPAPCAGKPVCR